MSTVAPRDDNPIDLDVQTDDAETEISDLIDIKAESLDDIALGDIWIGGIPLGKLLDKAIKKSKEATAEAERIDELEQKVEQLDGGSGSSDDDTGGQNGETTLHRPNTRLERLLADPKNAGERITKSVERSITIAGHFENWSEKVPAGRVIRSNLKKFLSTVAGESLAWKQVHRAGEKLHELTDGAIEWRKTDKHGWILVLRDESYLDRLTNVVSDKRGG